MRAFTVASTRMPIVLELWSPIEQDLTCLRRPSFRLIAVLATPGLLTLCTPYTLAGMKYPMTWATTCVAPFVALMLRSPVAYGVQPKLPKKQLPPWLWWSRPS